MNVSKYQGEAARTLLPEPGFEIPGKEMMLVWLALGLIGEAGEVAEHIKKGVLHRHGIKVEKVKEELGDVMWYVAGICTTLDLDLEEVLADNIKKLEIRYPQGTFTSEDSKKRVDYNLK